jgi:hypothetical protein
MKLMKSQKRILHLLVWPLSFLLLFGSCLGINADITLNQNGSGTLSLEYRISKSLDALGRLDGNERWNTIPVGRADFERSLDRLPDMKLLSFASKEDAKDLIINAKLEFANLPALLAFMDASGQRSSFTAGSLVFTLSEGTNNQNDSLNKLIASVSESYSVKLSMTFPANGTLVLTDKRGRALTALPGAEINSGGKKVSFSVPLYEVLAAGEGIRLEFRW